MRSVHVAGGQHAAAEGSPKDCTSAGKAAAVSDEEPTNQHLKPAEVLGCSASFRRRAAT